ncbi:MAG: hypothetical protein ACYTEQ_26110 [Planctomycetota bacterium]|jgi:hypothetical protein
MVGEKYLLVFLAAVVLVGQAGAEYEGDVEERWFTNCLLFEMEGRIWVNRRMVYLQMGIASGPATCLSEELANRLKPLVSDIAADSKSKATKVLPGYGIPQLSDSKGRLILLWMKAKMRPFFSERRLEYYEIFQTQIVGIEVISAQWVRAWEQLQRSLDDIISVSMTAPGDRKKRRLSETIEKGRNSLETMVSYKVSEAAGALVREVCPQAWLVGEFQKESACEWGGWLERFGERLGMGGGDTMGTYCERRPVYELLADCNSLTEFAMKIQKLPPGSIDTVLYRSQTIGWVSVGDIGNLQPAQFKKLREEVRASIVQKRQRKEEIEQLPDSTQTNTVEDYGLVLRAASAKQLATALVLSGTVVEKAAAGKKDGGLRAGDIVVDYARIYDLVVGGYYSYRKDWVANRIQYGHSLRVIRGNEVIELGGKSKE